MNRGKEQKQGKGKSTRKEEKLFYGRSIPDRSRRKERFDFDQQWKNSVRRKKISFLFFIQSSFFVERRKSFHVDFPEPKLRVKLKVQRSNRFLRTQCHRRRPSTKTRSTRSEKNSFPTTNIATVSDISILNSSFLPLSEGFLVETFSFRQGKWTREDFHRFLNLLFSNKKRPYCILSEQVDEFFRQTDFNGDGRIDFNEFIQAWKTMIRCVRQHNIFLLVERRISLLSRPFGRSAPWSSSTFRMTSFLVLWRFIPVRRIIEVRRIFDRFVLSISNAFVFLSFVDKQKVKKSFLSSIEFFEPLNSTLLRTLTIGIQWTTFLSTKTVTWEQRRQRVR